MKHRPLKPFGDGGTAHRMGYTLPMLTGWIESMAHDEEEEAEKASANGRIAKRFNKVQDALQLLNEACEEEYNQS